MVNPFIAKVAKQRLVARTPKSLSSNPKPEWRKSLIGNLGQWQNLMLNLLNLLWMKPHVVQKLVM